jgi:phage N-6-adenine-methyltransferase
MTLARFRVSNHPQQVGKRGATDEVDDRAIRVEDFAPLNERFRFTVDVAASPTNNRLPHFWTRVSDGLEQSWAGQRVWCNPPYSNIEPWVVKAWDSWEGTYERDSAELIVMLLPANRTEQKWWQRYVEPHRDRDGSFLSVEFLAGRMRFDRPGAIIGPKGDRPPFGCCLLIWSHVHGAIR